MDLYRDESFEKLFRRFLEDEEEIQRKVLAMRQFYSDSEEKKYGVLGIKIAII